MSDILLMAAGILGMAIACIHGWIGATKVVGPVANIPHSAKRILHAIMFLSAIYWFVGGLGLAIAPNVDNPGVKLLIVWIVSAMYLTGAAANCWATRGKHFGWMLLAIAAGLAISGGILRA